MPSSTTPTDAAATAAALDQLANAAAALAQAPTDLGAWYDAATGLCRLGEQTAGKLGLAVLCRTAADGGSLPLALCAACELRALDRDAASEAADYLARTYGAGSTRSAARRRPPAPPATAAPPVAAVSSQPPPPAATAATAWAASRTIPSTAGAATAALRADLRRALELAIDAARAKAADRDPGRPEFPIFGALAQAPFSRLVGALRLRHLGDASSIFREGDEARSLYLMARGRARIWRSMLDSPDGENVLCYLRPGAFFGEMAFLGETRRTANASCEGRVTVLELDRGDLGKLEQQFPEFARVLAEHARQRLLANLLSASPLFRGLDAEQRALAVQAFEPRIFAGGEQLLAEDERASGLYVIASGVVQLVKGRGADSTVLGELGVGEVVGEVSVIRRRPASASVRAATKVVAVFLGCEEFDRLAVDVPPLLAEVYRLATARERDLTMVLGGDALPADESLL